MKRFQVWARTSTLNTQKISHSESEKGVLFLYIMGYHNFHTEWLSQREERFEAQLIVKTEQREQNYAVRLGLNVYFSLKLKHIQGEIYIHLKKIISILSLVSLISFFTLSNGIYFIHSLWWWIICNTYMFFKKGI